MSFIFWCNIFITLFVPLDTSIELLRFWIYIINDKIIEKYFDIPVFPPPILNPPKNVIFIILKYTLKSNLIFVKKYRYKYGIIKNSIGDNNPYIGATTILNNEYIFKISSLLLNGLKYSWLKYTVWNILSSSILLSFNVHSKVSCKLEITSNFSCIFLNSSSSFNSCLIIFCFFFNTSIFVVGLFKLIFNKFFPKIVLVLFIVLNTEFEGLSRPLNISKSVYALLSIISLTSLFFFKTISLTIDSQHEWSIFEHNKDFALGCSCTFLSSLFFLNIKSSLFFKTFEIRNI